MAPTHTHVPGWVLQTREYPATVIFNRRYLIASTKPRRLMCCCGALDERGSNTGGGGSRSSNRTNARRCKALAVLFCHPEVALHEPHTDGLLGRAASASTRLFVVCGRLRLCGRLRDVALEGCALRSIAHSEPEYEARRRPACRARASSPQPRRPPRRAAAGGSPRRPAPEVASVVAPVNLRGVWTSMELLAGPE